MTSIHFAVLLVLITDCAYSNVDIERNEKDSTFGILDCTGFDRTTVTHWYPYTCVCKPEYTTMMSKDNENYNCYTPGEVGCDYSLTQSKLTSYLIATTRVSEQIITKAGENVTSIQRVLVWNLHPSVETLGNWTDVTDITTANFSLNVQSSGNTSLTVANMDLTTWGGLVIKVELGGKSSSKNCVILKVKGKISYPVPDIYKRLRRPSTTVRPLVTTKKTTPGPLVTTKKTTAGPLVTTPVTTTKIATSLPRTSTTGKVPSKATATKLSTLSTTPQKPYIPTTPKGRTAEIERSKEDTASGMECTALNSTTQTVDGGVYKTCTCSPQHATIMSKDNEIFNCHTPAEIGCLYTLANASKQASLITEDKLYEKIVPNVSENCSSVHRVLIWNLRPESNETGIWVDITNKTNANFVVNFQPNSNDSFLSVSNLDTDAWVGLTIKIELSGNRLCKSCNSSCSSCLIVKVQGVRRYPIHINELLKKLAATTTTTAATVTTAAAVTTQTTGTPSSGGQHKGDSNSTGTTVGIVVGIILAIVVAVVVCIAYRRRKGNKKMHLEEYTVGREKRNDHLTVVNPGYQADDLTVVNGGFEAGQYDTISYSHPSRVQLTDKDVGHEEVKTTTGEESGERNLEGSLGAI